MSRSLKKGHYISFKILKKYNIIINLNLKKIIKTWSRNSTILKIFSGFIFSIYNGKKHIPIYITAEMAGHKLGEFSFTRSFKGHSLKK